MPPVTDHDYWVLLGRFGTGKSSFASKMSPEYLVVDFDGRWPEMAGNVLGKYHIIQEPDIVKANREMVRRNPDLRGKVGTVIVDSITSILDYQQAAGRLDVANGNGNANDIHREKADIMRVLRGSVLTYHCNGLWIAHIEDGKMSGKDKTRITIPKIELERMKINLNAILVMDIDPRSGKRYVKIDWCRYNNNVAAGQVIFDTEMWAGVPQRISTFIRRFRGTEGYKGVAYSCEWLLAYLGSKGKPFGSVDEMKSQLGITSEPEWFNRNAWAEIAQRAGV
ncbi:MAG: AAA family ATPase [Chloroflexota bacterium]